MKQEGHACPFRVKLNLVSIIVDAEDGLSVVALVADRPNGIIRRQAFEFYPTMYIVTNINMITSHVM